MMFSKRQAGLWFVACLLSVTANAQNLEPRRWSHLPVGAHFIGAAYGFTSGDIFFDPVLSLEDATVDLDSLGVSYIYTFEWLGKSARFDANVPMAKGHWEGLLNGAHVETSRQGLLDPFFRISVNLWGAPPLKGKEFMAFRSSKPVHTSVGAALGVVVPAGEYFRNKLINLGSNRWILRPQIGVLHTRAQWEFEATASVFIFGDNSDFFPDMVRSQDPLWFLQGHVIRRLPKGMWMGVSGGYGFDGQSQINNVSQDDKGRVRYFALSFGMPINQRQNLKITCATSRTNTLVGSDLDSCSLAWSMLLAQ